MYVLCGGIFIYIPFTFPFCDDRNGSVQFFLKSLLHRNLIRNLLLCSGEQYLVSSICVPETSVYPKPYYKTVTDRRTGTHSIN